MKRNFRTVLATALLVGLVASAAPKKIENPAEMLKANSETVKSPILYKKGDRIVFNYLNTAGEKVVVLVKDSKDRILFREVFKGSLVVGKSFNFESAEEGLYRVVVRYEDHTEVETISVK